MAQEDTSVWLYRYASFYISGVDILRHFIVCLTFISMTPSYISCICLSLPDGLWGSLTHSPVRLNHPVILVPVTTFILTTLFYVLPLGKTPNFIPIKRGEFSYKLYYRIFKINCCGVRKVKKGPRCHLQRPRGRRHEMSSPAWALGPWDQIQLEAWWFVCSLSVFVLSCIGWGIATGWSPVQGVLPTICRIHT
jgi:hypothetical protein